MPYLGIFYVCRLTISTMIMPRICVAKLRVVIPGNPIDTFARSRLQRRLTNRGEPRPRMELAGIRRNEEDC